MSNKEVLESPQPETEKVPWIGIITIITLLFGLCGGVFLGAFYGVRSLVTEGMDKRSHMTGTPDLNQFLQDEDQIMSEYKNLGEGKIRIPITRAMELLVLEAKPEPVPEFVPEPPATSTPVTDTSTAGADTSVVKPDSDSVITEPTKNEEPEKGDH